LAYWHEPRFASGDSDPTYDPLWQALYAANADVVLNGHEHFYERFAPQNPDGVSDPTRGIREFIVGTGGRSFFGDQIRAPNSEVFNNNTFGVLQLTLHASSYGWQFLPGDGTFTDSGAGTCHTKPTLLDNITVSGINPASGPAAGGTTVTISGGSFSTTGGATTIQFGSNAATGVNCSSTTQCTATSPAGSGTVDVRVSVGGLTSPVSPGDPFTYISSALPPVALLASPQQRVDTRSSGGPLAAGSSRCFAVAGQGGIPTNAAAVVFNVTAVGYTANGHPCRAPRR
jgi:hypothetical protein